MTPLLLLLATAPARLAMASTVIGESSDVSRSEVEVGLFEEVKKRPDIDLISDDEAFAQTGGGLSDALKTCGSNDICVSEKLREIGADYGLIVVVNARLRPAFVSLELLEVSSGRTVASNIGEAHAAEGTLASCVRNRGVAIFATMGWKPMAKLLVQASPADARVEITRSTDRNIEKSAGGVWWLAPGTYRIDVSAPGFEPQELRRTLGAGREESIAVRLEPLEDGMWASPWTYVAAGAVVVGAGIAIALTAGGVDRCFCVQLGPKPCPISCP